MLKIANKSADSAPRITWESIRSALDQTRLEWTEETRQELEGLLDDLVGKAAKLKQNLEVLAHALPGIVAQ